MKTESFVPRTTCAACLLPLLMLLMLPAAVQAQFDYTTNNGTIAITRYTGPGGDVAIPSEIDGLPITEIGIEAFWNRIEVTSISIPHSVTTIGGRAFEGCTNLTNVTIPNSVTSIGTSAFWACSSLSTMTIPKGVTTIEDRTFWGCAKLSTVTIPNGIASIGDEAFYHCTSLTSVTVPDSVITIGNGAFCDCASLATVTIGIGVTNIGAFAFSIGIWGTIAGIGCSLTSLTVDPMNSSFSSVDGVLFSKDQTRLIQYPGSRGGRYVIPNTVAEITAFSFFYCQGLISVTIPNSVTTIESGCFFLCQNLTNVTIGKSVENIGDGVFSNDDNLIEIAVDSSNLNYSSIDGVLFNKSRTTLVRYPQGKEGAYVIPYGVTRIESAFSGCRRLASITIPNTVNIIGGDAFIGCSKLSSVSIPNSVRDIGYRAFGECTSLTNVTIGNGLSMIGALFDGCTNLDSVHFCGDAPQLGEAGPFTYGPYPTIYYLPGTMGWASTFGGRPTAPWVLPYPVILSIPPNFGVRSNAFGFRISWATNASIVVEACTNLTNPAWSPVATNTLSMGTDPLTDGWSYFTDLQWTNHPTRFYRLRSP